jgi:hypothetical protein
MNSILTSPTIANNYMIRGLLFSIVQDFKPNVVNPLCLLHSFSKVKRFAAKAIAELAGFCG